MKPEILTVDSPWNQRFRWVTQTNIPIHDAQIEAVLRRNKKPYEVVACFFIGNGIEVINGDTGEFEISLTPGEVDQIFQDDDTLSLTIYIAVLGLQKVRVCKRFIERS